MLRALRLVAVAAAAGCLVLLLLVALNLARVGSIHLERFREPTWALYAALAVFVLARRDPASSIRAWADRVHSILVRPRFFAVMAGTMLLLYVIAAWTQHLSFHTFSHDFSMIDEALVPRPLRPLLYSPVLGRSFLSEHFSPILLLLVPFHAVIRSPYFAVALQPMALWASGVVLRSILTRLGVSRATGNLACLAYWNNPVQVATLLYLFHMECFLPLFVFAMVLGYVKRDWLTYVAALALTLTVKEDAGLYVAGFGLYIALADRRRALGVLTAIAGIAWTVFALHVAMPAIAGQEHGYPFLTRWSAWGDGPASVLVGFLTHPGRFARALVAWSYVKFFARLLYTPLLAPAGWLLFLIPWIVPATSGVAQQAMLGLYYGGPLLAFSAIAGAFGLVSPAFRRIVSPRLALGAACVAVALNVSHLSYPEIPRTRGRFLDELAAIPDTTAVQAMSCFFPVLGYTREKSLIESGTELTARYAILRTDGTPWPLRPGEAQAIVGRALASGRYENRSSVKDFYILCRRARPAPPR